MEENHSSGFDSIEYFWHQSLQFDVSAIMSRSALALLLVCALPAGVGACMSTPPSQMVQITQERLLGQWSLVRVGTRPVSRAMSLEFRREGIMIGSLRCNSMSGRYEVRPPAIVFPDDVIITAAGCNESWPSNRSATDIAERVLFSIPPATLALSADMQRIYVMGDVILEFQRAR
ncbi:MAG: META domain-containing protein [Novosphingobium sp.]|nr:META domain-containing protein [Novosphingobium sp.]